MENRTMTVNQVAEYLGVCADTVYNMVRANEIPHFRLRRRILFRLESIEKWMDQQEQL